MQTRKDILDAIAARYELSELEVDGLLVCENGDCRVAICYRDRDDYCGAVWVEQSELGSVYNVWLFDDLHPPQILTQGSPLQGGYDCTEALEHMAQTAASFGDYFTSGAGGDEAPQEWNPRGSYYSEAAHGTWDEDGPIFKAVTR